MPIIPIPYGAGLERADGIMVKRPNMFEDLRNVYLYRGKAHARRGLLNTGTVLPGDITVMLSSMRWLNAVMAASFNDTSRVIILSGLDSNGQNPVTIGPFGTLTAQAQYDPPVVVAADSDNKLIIAHTEPNYLARFPTRYYDPSDAGSPTFDNLFPLEADLGAGQVEPIKFRGVTRHLSYIFGWGHGQGNFPNSSLTPDRPDVVRVSNSGDPLTFQDFAFFDIGQQGEPVMVCRSAGQFLMCFKENETHQIFGYSPDTFGVRMSDMLFGCVGERLAVTVGNNVFFWSTQGPRMTSGGDSIDLAVPLDIEGPDPVGLAAESDPSDAFAVYDAETRVVQFVWGRRVYALSIRYPSEPRWSYYELGETIQCGDQLYSSAAQSGGGGSAPTGGPDILQIITHGPGVEVGSIGTLTLTSNPLDTETFTIGTTVYTFQAVLTDADGNVLIGLTASDSLDNLIAHIMLTAGAGTIYAASGTIDPLVAAAAGAGDTMDVTEKVPIPTATPTTDTSVDAGNTWGFAVLIGGLNIGDDGYSEDPQDVTLIIDNADSTGGETIEIYAAMYDNSDLSLLGYVRIANIIVGSSVQRTTIRGGSLFPNQLLPLYEYAFAIRYLRAFQSDPLWSTSPPSTWPAPSQRTVTLLESLATFVSRPTGGANQGVWVRSSSSEQSLTLAIVHAPGHEFLDFEVERRIDTLGDISAQNIGGDGIGPPDTANANQNPSAIIDLGEVAGDTELVDDSPIPDRLNVYRINYIAPPADGAYSAPLTCWPGPDGPDANTLAGAFEANDPTVFVSWINALLGTVPADRSVNVWSVNETQEGGVVPWSEQFFSPGAGSNPADGLYTFQTPAPNDNDTARIGIRYSSTVFGVQHWSPWAIVTATPNYITGLIGEGVV